MQMLQHAYIAGRFNKSERLWKNIEKKIVFF